MSAGRYRRTSGQASVEYLVIGLVVIVAAAGLALLWRHVSGSDFPALVGGRPSHGLGQAGGVLDVLLY